MSLGHYIDFNVDNKYSQHHLTKTKVIHGSIQA